MKSGSFFLIGGDDDKTLYWDQVSHFCQQVMFKRRLLILMDMFPNYKDWVPEYEQNFRQCGFQEVYTWVPDLKDSSRPESIAKAISHSDAIFIFGGNTSSYCFYYVHLPIIQAIQQALTRGLSYIGLSSGAMLLGPEVILAGEIWHAEPNNFQEMKFLLPGLPDVTKRSPGLGLFPNILFDVHFSQRKRQPRLLNALNYSKKAKLAFGIDSNMAVLIQGNDAYCFGEGQVAVYEKTGQDFKQYVFSTGQAFKF